MLASLKNGMQHIHNGITNTLEDGKQKNAIPELDGIRAIACLLVIFFHLNYISTKYAIWRPVHDFGAFIGATLLFGETGVTLFFVLSGFLLFLPYARTMLFHTPWPSTRIFYLKRIFRIVPAYYISLLLLVLIVHPEYLDHAHREDIKLFLLFFMDAPSTFQKINGPFWTLAVEAQFYLWLPLLACGMALLVRHGSLVWRIVTLGLCLFALIAWGILSRYWGNYFMLHTTESLLGIPRSLFNTILLFLYGNRGKYLEDFAVGMVLASCFVYAKYTPRESRWNTTIRRFSPVIWLAGLVVLSFMVLWHFNHGFYGYTLHVFDPLIHYYDVWSEVIISLGYGLCTAGVLYGPAWLRAPFAWSPLRWLGLISYSLYIWHVPLMIAFATYVIQGRLHTWSHAQQYLAYALFVALIIIPFAVCFHIMVEKPWIQIGERLRLFLQKKSAPSLQSGS